MRAAVAVAARLVATAGARADAGPCPDGLAARVLVDLIFGRNIGEVLGVSEEAWSRFLDEEVTPRFPDGLTVFDARGQWRDLASGRIVREPGKVLTIILADEGAQRPLLAEITQSYKRRFNQQSVITLQRRVCVSF